MASNPRIPDEERLRLSKVQRPTASRAAAITTRGVLAGLLGVAALAALFYYASRLAHEPTAVVSHGESVPPADGEGPQSELEFRDIQMETPGNGRLDIFGSVRNSGNHHITAVVVQLTFKDAKGKKLATIEQPIHGQSQGASSALADEFPIEPDQSRFFQVVIHQVPLKWNRELPGLKVVTVSASE